MVLFFLYSICIFQEVKIFHIEEKVQLFRNFLLSFHISSEIAVHICNRHMEDACKAELKAIILQVWELTESQYDKDTCI